jgi:SAM-dependent methyltransferase
MAEGYADPVAADLEYSGLKARAWDALRGDTSDWVDRAFYLELINELGQPVLDVGCGTGRLLLDFLAAGVDIDGVEISPDMLAILRARSETAGVDLAGRVHQSAMETMSLPRRYRLILVPSSSFQLLVNPTDAVGAMQRFHDHLESRGTLVMPWIDIAQDYPDGATDARTREITLEDESVVRLAYRGWFEPATGLEHTDELYERLIDGKVVEQERIVRSPATRQYDRAMIQSLHAMAGLGELQWLSGFTRNDARPGDRIITTLARGRRIASPGI